MASEDPESMARADATEESTAPPPAAADEDDESVPPLLAAVTRNDVTEAQALIADGADPNCTDLDGTSALSVAAFFGYNRMIAALLEAPALTIDAASRTCGWTALISAASKGRKTATAALLAAGADPVHVDLYGKDASQYAADNGFPEVAAGIDTFVATGKLPPDFEAALAADGDDAGPPTLESAVAAAIGQPPPEIIGGEADHVFDFLLACDRGDLRGVAAALAAGEVTAAAVDEDGSSGLHAAAFKNHPQVLELLCERGADLAAVNVHGWTALHAACAKGSADCVRVLLRRGIDPSTPDVYNKTALDYAKAGLNLPQDGGSISPSVTQAFAEIEAMLPVASKMDEAAAGPVTPLPSSTSAGAARISAEKFMLHLAAPPADDESGAAAASSGLRKRLVTGTRQVAAASSETALAEADEVVDADTDPSAPVQLQLVPPQPLRLTMTHVVLLALIVGFVLPVAIYFLLQRGSV